MLTIHAACDFTLQENYIFYFFHRLTAPLVSCLSQSTAMDFDLCTSNSGDGCGGSFPYKTSPGLCAKCQKLATLQPDCEEHVTWSVGLVSTLKIIVSSLLTVSTENETV